MHDSMKKIGEQNDKLMNMMEKIDKRGEQTADTVRTVEENGKHFSCLIGDLSTRLEAVQDAVEVLNRGASRDDMESLRQEIKEQLVTVQCYVSELSTSMADIGTKNEQLDVHVKQQLDDLQRKLQTICLMKTVTSMDDDQSRQGLLWSYGRNFFVYTLNIEKSNAKLFELPFVAFLRNNLSKDR